MKIKNRKKYNLLKEINEGLVLNLSNKGSEAKILFDIFIILN